MRTPARAESLLPRRCRSIATDLYLKKAPGAKVVKAFNTTFARPLGEGRVAGQPLDVLIASDDAAAKQTLSRIVADGGMRPIDAGPLKRAREIEALGYLHMALQQPLDTNYASAVKILS